jgi:hypothetical protein
VFASKESVWSIFESKKQGEKTARSVGAKQNEMRLESRSWGHDVAVCAREKTLKILSCECSETNDERQPPHLIALREIQFQ